MTRHLLEPVGTESVAGVVRRLGAIPAKDEGLAELAIRMRQTRSRSGQIASALAEGRIIKSYVFRGGTHFLAPEDAGAYLALRASGRQWELPSWQEYYELKPTDWPAFRATVREALMDGPLTIKELGAAVTRKAAYRHWRPVFDEGAGTLIKPLTWQGDISFGPPRDGQHTSSGSITLRDGRGSGTSTRLGRTRSGRTFARTGRRPWPTSTTGSATA